jgi:precorrin-6Y C5,15-methyltransferase (decarboxylating)
MTRLFVIGIGYKPFEQRARDILINSQVILASDRLLEVFKGYSEFEIIKDKIKVFNNVDKTIEFIRNFFLQPSASGLQPNFKPITLLASGDPMFFGIGRRAVKEFGKDNVEILPDLSSIQVAFSRIKEPWDDAFLISLHGGPDPEKRRRLPYEMEDIPLLLKRHNKIAILTDKENNPSKIALFLSSVFCLQPSALKMYVCERLGYPDEKIIEGTVEEIAGMTFSEPNVVIIQKTEDRRQSTEIVFGFKEDEITHSRGLITKDEIRAVTIHKLRLPLKGIVWDIGAGSGSVSIEIARLNPYLKVFAIEKDKEQIENIRKNKISFNTKNIEIIEGIAPEILKTLPKPDRIFIGGSGNRLREIIDFVSDTIEKGIVVINAVQLETLSGSIDLFNKKGFSVDVLQLNISRMKNISSGNYFSSLNPVFIIIAEACAFKARV